MALAFTIVFLCDYASGALPPVVGKEPTPAWVVMHRIRAALEVPVNDIQNGQHFLLADEQIKVDNAGPTRYFQRYAIQVVNETGMTASSQISVVFDPNYQDLVFHRLLVHRGTSTIYKLAEAEIQLLRREEKMESLVYDGRYTASLIVSDVRVGDIIDYAYTIVGSNPIYKGAFSHNLRVSWGVPVREHHFILHWPKTRKLHFRNHKTSLALSKQAKGDAIIYSLEQEHITGIPGNTETPTWYLRYGTIQMTEVADWGEVVSWAESLYRRAYREADSILEVAEQIKRSHGADEERAAAALNYVQSKIRYLGIEMGVNSHLPSLPGETLQRRYGDCKDKSVVLIVLLRALGMDACPALVNSHLQHVVRELHPSIDAFDHVIVRACVGGTYFWLDPTRLYQGSGLSDLFQPNYGFGLVVAPGENQLTPMPSNSSLTGIYYGEVFDLRAGPGEPAVYSVSTRHYGRDAETIRYQHAEESGQKIGDGYIDYYRKSYPDIEPISPIEFRDNELTNEMTTSERYRIPGFWTRGHDSQEWEANFHASGILGYLRKPEQLDRTEPYGLAYPANAEHAIRVLLPQQLDIEGFDFREENPFFKLTASSSYDSKTNAVELVYGYRALKDFVTPREIPDYVAALDKVGAQLNYHVLISEERALLDRYAGAALIVMLLFPLAYITAELLIDSRRSGQAESGFYYPVSAARFAFLSSITIGLYPVYWLYRNWRYIRRRDDSPIMPFWRAVFLPIWFYAFYRDLRRDSMVRFGKRMLPEGAWAVVLLALYCMANLVDRFDGALSLVPFLSFLCLLPFVNYVHYVNRDRPELIALNARMRPRHLILGGYTACLLLFYTASTLSWIPGSEVMDGHQLPDREIKYMQRRGILEPGEELLYFYSDGFWSFRDDGNGVTDRRVFSYWRDDRTGKLNINAVEFGDIADISVAPKTSLLDTTAITVKSRDGASFGMYAPDETRSDRRFLAEIRKRANLYRSGSTGETVRSRSL